METTENKITLSKEQSEDIAKRIELMKVILLGAGFIPSDWQEQAGAEKPDTSEMNQLLASVRTQGATKLFTEMIQTGADMDYVFAMADEMRGQASWQESAAVLNPSYDQTKNDLLYEQARALSFIGKFMDSLKKCHELKLKAESNKKNLDHIQGLFV